MSPKHYCGSEQIFPLYSNISITNEAQSVPPLIQPQNIQSTPIQLPMTAHTLYEYPNM